MINWNRLRVADFQHKLAAGSATPLDWWKSCRKQIDLQESRIQAWEALASEPAIAVHGKDHSWPKLCGVPVGIKDIIETANLPTTWGTRGYHTMETSQMDASIVAQLKTLGALPMGKTVSTEYAYFQPNKTRNPCDPTRTPGGSSSGSAAAVASGMVPIALGTQTVGSIIRPASYCGVVGFKPTHGTLSTSGVKALAPSMDTVGWFSRYLDDSCLLFTALTGAEPITPKTRLDGVRVGLTMVPSSEPPTADVIAALDDAANKMTTLGAHVTPIKLEPLFDKLVAHQQVILAYEAARALYEERRKLGASMSPVLKTLLDEGQSFSLARYWQARQAAERGRALLTQYFTEQVDIILTPSATGVAPVGLESTGDPLYSRVWTLLGVPCINLPLYLSPKGLPVGVQLIADRYQDHHLLSIASALTP